MLFNSLHFVGFYLLILFLFFAAPKKWRWLILLIGSYYFYMSWKAEYLILILLTTVVSYASGLLMERAKSRAQKGLYLWGSLLISLGVLFFFKYFNFVSENIVLLFQSLGFQPQPVHLSYLLPVGISFYTFQTLSYSVDVYRGVKSAERHFGIYALYVSFFPQLVAGPIERSTSLLPQLKDHPVFKWVNVSKGLKLIVIGFFLKLVIADRASLYVDAVFNHVDQHGGLTFLLATFLFSFQIYGDFAGYSSIAIGVAMIMGYDLMTNFRRPYLAKSLTDFWRRWHISLSSWFRDYVYIPLGGNRSSTLRWAFNIGLTFIISGIWHGAAWTFIVWGAIHGLIIILEKVTKFDNLSEPKAAETLARVFFVFTVASIAWVFFRANSIDDALQIYRKIFTHPGTLYLDIKTVFFALLGILIISGHDIYEEYFSRRGAWLESRTGWVSALYLSLMTVLIFYLGVFNGGQFIYFQF